MEFINPARGSTAVQWPSPKVLNQNKARRPVAASQALCRLFLALVLICAWFSSAAMAESKTGGAGPSQVTVAIGTDSTPYYFLDEHNRPSGLVVDLWRLWSRKTGIKVVFKSYSFANSLKAVARGEADIQAGCFYSEERDKYLDYVSPVAVVSTHFFYKRTIFGIRGIKDLSGFRVGVIDGDVALEHLRKELPEASLAIYPDNRALFAAVASGQVVAFVKDTAIALAMLAKQGLLNTFRYPAGQPLYEQSWLCAVRQGDQALPAIIRQGMRQISSSERSELEQRWTGTVSSSPGDVLVIACPKDYPPFSMLSRSGNATGMLVELWRLWAQKTGRKIKFRFFSAEEALAAVKQGQADIHAGLFRTPAVQKDLDLSQPFYLVESGFFSKPGPGAPKSLADLAAKKVAAVVQSQQLVQLRKSHPEMLALGLTAPEDLVDQIHSGDLDAILAEVPVVNALLESRGERGFVELLPWGRFTSNLHAAVAKGNQKLWEEVSKGLDAISDQELAGMEERWVSDPGIRQIGHRARQPQLTEAERSWLAEHKVALMGGESNWPPLEFADQTGRYAGVAADYLKLISGRLGFRFEVITDYPWNRMIEMAKERQVAGITCIAQNQEREKFLNFSEPYFISPYVIVTHKDYPTISGIKDLLGQRVAVEKDFFLHGRIAKEYPRVELLPLQNTLESLRAVAAGRAQAYIGNLMVIKHLINQNAINELKVAAPAPWPGSKLRIAIRNDWPLLLSAINKALATISPLEHQRINRRWLESASAAPVALPQPALTQHEKDWLAKHKVAIFAAESNWPPVNFVDSAGNFAGVTADYVKLISRRLGLRMEMVTDYPWAQMVDMCNTKQIDGITSIVQTPDRAGQFHFSAPYFVSPLVVITRRSHPPCEGLKQLAGDKIAVERGYHLHQKLITEYPDQAGPSGRQHPGGAQSGEPQTGRRLCGQPHGGAIPVQGT